MRKVNQAKNNNVHDSNFNVVGFNTWTHAVNSLEFDAIYEVGDELFVKGRGSVSDMLQSKGFLNDLGIITSVKYAKPDKMNLKRTDHAFFDFQLFCPESGKLSNVVLSAYIGAVSVSKSHDHNCKVHLDETKKMFESNIIKIRESIEAMLLDKAVQEAFEEFRTQDQEDDIDVCTQYSPKRVKKKVSDFDKVLSRILLSGQDYNSLNIAAKHHHLNQKSAVPDSLCTQISKSIVRIFNIKIDVQDGYKAVLELVEDERASQDLSIYFLLKVLAFSNNSYEGQLDRGELLQRIMVKIERNIEAGERNFSANELSRLLTADPCLGWLNSSTSYDQMAKLMRPLIMDQSVFSRIFNKATSFNIRNFENLVEHFCGTPPQLKLLKQLLKSLLLNIGEHREKFTKISKNSKSFFSRTFCSLLSKQNTVGILSLWGNLSEALQEELYESLKHTLDSTQLTSLNAVLPEKKNNEVFQSNAQLCDGGGQKKSNSKTPEEGSSLNKKRVTSAKRKKRKRTPTAKGKSENQSLEEIHKKSLPLHIAVKSGDKKAVKTLLNSKKHNIFEEDEFGMNAYELAYALGQSEIAIMIIGENKLSFDQYYRVPDKIFEQIYREVKENTDSSKVVHDIRAHIECSGVGVLEAYIDAGVNKDLVLSQQDGSLLHSAVIYCRPSLIKMLLERGADPNNTKSTKGRTPLHIAAMMGYADCCSALLEGNADVDAIDKAGNTPLHLATEFCDKIDYEPTASVLLKHGARLNEATKYGTTPLHIAAELRYHEAAKFLLDRGASIYVRSREDMTPAAYALKNGDLNLLKLFWNKGLDLNANIFQGMTAFQISSFWGKVDITRELINRGIDINSCQSNRDISNNVAWKGEWVNVSALQIAARKGHTEVAALLLEHGAILCGGRQGGELSSPIIEAAENGHTLTVLLFLLWIMTRSTQGESHDHFFLCNIHKEYSKISIKDYLLNIYEELHNGRHSECEHISKALPECCMREDLKLSKKEVEIIEDMVNKLQDPLLQAHNLNFFDLKRMFK